jgi:hypothetical protein
MPSLSYRNFHQGKSRIDSLIQRAKSVDNLQIQSDLACYICVRISGLIETTVQEFYIDYAESKSAPTVAKYVSHKLRRFQNPDMNNLKELAKEFSEEWSTELGSIDQEIQDAVTSIVKTRHSIAHGADQRITLGKVEAYYRQVIKVLLVIQQQCNITED